MPNDDHAPTGLGWVLLCDLVASREVQDRRRLDAALETLGTLSPATWRRGPQRMKGIDEWGALLARPQDAFSALTELAIELHPHRFRGALAYGEIDVRPEAQNIAQMDGEVFHAAARALDRAKREEHAFELGLEHLLRGREDEEELTAMSRAIVSLADLHAGTVRGWTDAQLEVVRGYQAHGTQRAVAAELDVSAPTVSRHLQRARYAELDAARKSIEQLMTCIVRRLGAQHG